MVVRYNSALVGCCLQWSFPELEITIFSRQVLLSALSWFYGLFMQAGSSDLETLLFSWAFALSKYGAGFHKELFPRPFRSKGWRICACFLCHWDVNSVCPQSCKPQTLCTLDFKPFQDLDLICSKCCCSARGENGSRNCLAVAAKKQPKLQNKQNLQGTGSRINFRNSALPLIKKIIQEGKGFCCLQLNIVNI